MSSPFADENLLEGLPPPSVDDKEMALAFQRGDRDAYRAIHDRYEERVQRVCRRMLSKREDAQEAAQETFLRVYLALGKFNGRYQLGAWITRIATNVCLDQIRSRSRRPVEPMPLEDLEPDLVASRSDADPEAVVVRNAESRRVRKVLLGLPPLHRAAIVLRDFEGLSYAEVAVVLGLSECQVKALIHRARKGFRRSWTGLAQLLVPARLLERWRATDPAAKEHAVSAAASQGAPIASICSGVLQQCGSFVVDKVVVPVTVFMIGGTSALAGVGTAPQPSPEVHQEAAADAAAAAVREGAASHAAPSARPAETDAPASAPPSTPPTTTASPEPSPTPSPTAGPSPAPATASPDPAEGTVVPKESPSPAPFTPTFYFEKGQTPTPRAPSAHTAKVDCAARSFEQVATATISDHEGAYPIDLRIWASSSLSIEFTVRKQGVAVYYSGGGSVTASSNSGNQLNLSFVGRYGSGGGAAASANLPPNGSIRADFTLDCQAQSLIAESIVFTTQ